MTIGVVNAPKAAYQGSGLETGTIHEAPETEAVSPAKMEDGDKSSSVKVENNTRDSSSVKTENSEEIVFNSHIADNASAKREADIQVEAKENKRSDSVKRAVEEINRKAKNSEAIFGFHDATNRVTIKIVDKDTREILKEYPPEETLDMIAKIWELAGIMIDEKG